MVSLLKKYLGPPLIGGVGQSGYGSCVIVLANEKHELGVKGDAQEGSRPKRKHKALYLSQARKNPFFGSQLPTPTRVKA